ALIDRRCFSPLCTQDGCGAARTPGMRVGTPGFIPARLTEIRDARRIPSRAALARRLDSSASSVSRWEDQDSVQTPDPAMLVRMAGELRVRPEYFLRDTYESDRP